MISLRTLMKVSWEFFFGPFPVFQAFSPLLSVFQAFSPLLSVFQAYSPLLSVFQAFPPPFSGNPAPPADPAAPEAPAAPFCAAAAPLLRLLPGRSPLFSLSIRGVLLGVRLVCVPVRVSMRSGSRIP